MANLNEVFKGMEMEQQIERNAAKQYIEAELGDTIGSMTFREIADTIQEAFELDDRQIADILTCDMALDFEDDITYTQAMDMRECGCCGKQTLRSDMRFTKDCHGIPFRLACMACYLKAMDEGFDGEYYTEADEQIDDDY